MAESSRTRTVAETTTHAVFSMSPLCLRKYLSSPWKFDCPVQGGRIDPALMVTVIKLLTLRTSSNRKKPPQILPIDRKISTKQPPISPGKGYFHTIYPQLNKN